MGFTNFRTKLATVRKLDEGMIISDISNRVNNNDFYL